MQQSLNRLSRAFLIAALLAFALTAASALLVRAADYTARDPANAIRERGNKADSVFPPVSPLNIVSLVLVVVGATGFLYRRNDSRTS